jgi:hypothetical protein
LEIWAIGCSPQTRELDRSPPELGRVWGRHVVDDQIVECRLTLERRDVKNLVAMGPSGHHLDAVELDAIVAALPEVSGVSAAKSVTELRLRR